MISVHCVNMHRAFENACKFINTTAISIQKIMARDHNYFITLQLNFKALLHSYKLLSLAIFLWVKLCLQYINNCAQSLLRNADFVFSHWKPQFRNSFSITFYTQLLQNDTLDNIVFLMLFDVIILEPIIWLVCKAGTVNIATRCFFL